MALLLLLTGSLLLAPAPAGAAACPGTSGVTVVVQFPDNHTEIGCAPGDPSSGLDALTKAGFDPQPVQGQPGTVCTLKGQPSNGDCWNPPNSWSYWHGTSGGTWTKSDFGAGSYDPAPGSVEGWRFATDAYPTTPPPTTKPTYTPSRLPVIPPPPSSTRTPGTKPSATATASVLVPTAGPTAGASGLGVPTAPGAGGPTTFPTASVAATSESTAAASVGKSTTHASTPAAHHSGGLSWLWGIALLAVVAAAGAVAAVRRKRA